MGRKKTGRYGKYGEIKRKERAKQGRTLSGRDRIKLDEHRKIAPGRPNNGRR
jgi:hypothetical protein